MKLRKFRWSKDYESAEEELVQLFTAKAIQADIWYGKPDEILTTRSDIYDKTFWCAEGSLTVKIDGKLFSLQPGDALDIPSGAVCEGFAGMTGCICYESTTATQS
jgi:mannose-6-phosphate isomerase-like protein (cupin superfamily)